MASTSDIPVWKVTKPYINLDCELGEGPFYEEDTQKLRFVDIVGKKLHRFHVDKGQDSLESFDTGDAVGHLVGIRNYSKWLRLQNGQVTNVIKTQSAKYGFARLDRSNGKLEYIAKFYTDEQKKERMRANDGSIDPAGRFLCGTMTDQSLHEVIKEGSLMALEPAASGNERDAIRTILSDITIPNGLGWSADGKTMYFADSPTFTIWKYDYDASSGTATNRCAWFVMKHTDTAGDIPPDATPPDSVPDGFAMDANGDIWSAVWGAGKVLRIRDVDGRGEVVGCVTLPAEKITCTCFVGEDLIVTSAKGGGQWEGCVFRVNVGVRGAAVSKWRSG